AGVVTHTYSNNGTYVAQLETAPGNINPANYTPSIVGSVQIMVGDTVEGSELNADPSSGPAPLSVNFSYRPSINDQANYYVEFGDGQGELMSVQQIYCFRAPCISPQVASHT